MSAIGHPFPPALFSVTQVITSGIRTAVQHMGRAFGGVKE